MENKDNKDNKESNDIDIQLFEKGIIGLFTLIKTIIRCHSERNIDTSGKKNPVLAYFEQYEQIYHKTTSIEHVQYFNNIYRAFRTTILKGSSRDEWLRDGKIIIKYGSETGLDTNSRIYLSAVYNTACSIRRDIEEEMDGLPDIGQSKEMLYPIAFMLHLYRIFLSIAPKNDTEKLSIHLDEILSSLGIQITNSKRNNDNDNNNDNNDNNANNTGLQPLFNMAKQVMGQMGMDIPTDQMPKAEELTGAIGQMFNKPETINIFGELFKDIQNTNNIGDVMSKLVSKLGDESLQKKISQTMGNPLVQDTINSSLEKAIEPSKTNNNNNTINTNTNNEPKQQNNNVDEIDEFDE